MNKKTLIVTVVASALAMSVAAPTVAQSTNDRSERGQQSHGGRGHGGDRLTSLIEAYDTDGDGGVTQAEIDTARADRLALFDTDENGQLSLAEYEVLWLDAMRERMVDQFQAHDDDGDGQVTVVEFEEDYAGIVNRADRNGDGVLNSDDRRRPRDEAEAETQAEE